MMNLFPRLVTDCFQWLIPPRSNLSRDGASTTNQGDHSDGQNSKEVARSRSVQDDSDTTRGCFDALFLLFRAPLARSSVNEKASPPTLSDGGGAESGDGNTVAQKGLEARDIRSNSSPSQGNEDTPDAQDTTVQPNHTVPSETPAEAIDTRVEAETEQVAPGLADIHPNAIKQMAGSVKPMEDLEIHHRSQEEGRVDTTNPQAYQDKSITVLGAPPLIHKVYDLGPSGTPPDRPESAHAQEGQNGFADRHPGKKIANPEPSTDEGRQPRKKKRVVEEDSAPPSEKSTLMGKLPRKKREVEEDGQPSTSHNAH